ncbi:hypothetical protein HAX54_017439 [Datura stramonium]|uniref:PSII 6.1 kDa protein n=1 Tax=Datura stramonium TaxID=4076 RepID=A0ABS8ULG8_DATST|nr:hypothetical protein [Datura stramonium]
MATISACNSSVARAASCKRDLSACAHDSGLPSMSKVGKVRCSMEEKPKGESKLGMGESLMAAAVAASMSNPAAMALVDERMSTEGTGLPFGLSNSLHGWIF